MNEENKPWGWAALLRWAAVLMVLALALLPVTAHAASPAKVIPVGRAVGIKLFSDGVVVVGTSEVQTSDGKIDPAKACGLKVV